MSEQLSMTTDTGGAAPSHPGTLELPGDLTKAQASEHIDRLQGVTGLGRGGSTGDSDSGSAG